jgi:hypothetical protein
MTLKAERKRPGLSIEAFRAAALRRPQARLTRPYTACTSITPGTALMAPAICGETL